MPFFVTKDRPKSLSSKLTVTIVLTGFAFLVCTLGLSFLSARKALYRQFDSTQFARLSHVFRWVEQRDEDLRIHVQGIVERTPFNALITDGSHEVIEIRDWQGVIAARIPDREQPQFVHDVQSLEDFESWNMDLADGTKLRVISHRFLPRLDSGHHESFPRHPAYIFLASDRSLVEDEVRRQAYWLGGVGFCVVVLTGLMVPFVVRRSLAPLDKLTQRAEKIEATVLDERFPTKSLPGELLPISQCLNRLLERLERSFKRERSFTSDVAHELLTPVAEMRALTEYALRYPDVDSRDSLTQLLGILQRVEAIVETLLDLCRAEQEGLQAGLAPVRLFEIVGEAIQRHASLSDVRKIDWKLRVPREASLIADANRIEVILSNLISNAGTYAEEGSAVEIEWVESAGKRGISVANKAPLLAQDQVGQLFERFWRQDKSRSSSGHYGLGLCLSKELAQSMNLVLEARLSQEGVLIMSLFEADRFDFELP